METSRTFAALALLVGITGALGCGASDSESCEATRSCATAGVSAGGASGAAGAAGAAGAPSAAMAGAPDGTSCDDGSSCRSGNCVDGVCCDSACDGVCESCSAEEHLGTCTPYADGTDPESECLGEASPGDACAGACDGSSACSFPNESTACGSTSCMEGAQTGPVCAGDGRCISAQTSCGTYACGVGQCETSCSDDSDCDASAWCASGECVAKAANGEACGSGRQCESDSCVSSVCCATACDAPSSCSTGQCLCGGTACAAGSACVVWHEDQDGDGVAGTAGDVIACEDQQPGPSFYLTAGDCDDANRDAFPGQTAFFNVARANGSFDYDCDGQEARETPVVGSKTCRDCRGTTYVVGSLQCYDCADPGNLGPQATYGFECNASCGVKTKAGFHVDPGCGNSGTLASCSATSCTPDEQQTSGYMQRCH